MLQNCSTSVNQSRKPEWSVVDSWSETKHNYRAKKSGRLWLPSDFEVEFFASLASAPPLVFHSRVVPNWLSITAPHTSLMGSRFLEGKTFTYRFWIAIIDVNKMNDYSIKSLWGYLNLRSLDNVQRCSINWRETKYNSEPNQTNASIA